MKKTIFLFIFLVSPFAKTHDTDWVEANKIAYAQCFDPEHFTDFNSVNPALYATICSFLAKHPDLSYNHHDDIRRFTVPHAPRNKRQARSMHHNGGALDWRAHSYEGLSWCERYLAFSKWVPKFYRHLQETGLSEKARLGL